jgi:heme-degrading monooxygenase HmoA
MIDNVIASPKAQTQQHLYRIDKFKVPPSARDEFLNRAREVQDFLSTQPGFVKNGLFEQSSGSGAFNFVTIVEWESAEAVEGAKKAITARFEASGFNSQELRARLGIEADVAIYSEVPRPVPAK